MLALFWATPARNRHRVGATFRAISGNPMVLFWATLWAWDARLGLCLFWATSPCLEWATSPEYIAKGRRKTKTRLTGISRAEKGIMGTEFDHKRKRILIYDRYKDI
jgi:hypothetical protein